MKRYWLALLLLLLVNAQVMAQHVFPSLESCIRFAFQHRPDLQNERLNETLAQQQKKLTTAPLLPQVKAFSTFDDYLSLPIQLIPAEFLGGPAGEFRPIQFGTQYGLVYGFEANLPLISLQNWQNRKVAETEVQVARYRKYSNFQAAAEQIAQAYYMVLLTREATAIALENMQVNDTLLLTANQKFENGILEPLEYNRLKALQLESKQTWHDNQTAYQRNQYQLKTLLGLPADAPLELTEMLSDMQQNFVSLTTTPEESNQYLAMQWRLRVAEREWQKQKARWAPEVWGYGNYSRQRLSNEVNVFNSDLPWLKTALIGLRLDWPLFTGFNRSISIRQAKLNKQIAENNLVQQALKTKQEYAELLLDYSNAQNSLQAYREHYALYQDNYALALYKYRQDVYSTDQLLQVFAEKLRSQNRYIYAVGNYYISRSLIQLKNEFAKPENPLPYDTK
ncbi:TolC family protein [Adhaeribacter soli]|uniref:TolC family protein n=1 Tax=Adhaeribacter soli TaxID=2607655 RepID=A0A5N1ITX2_9BACT|nr:TolC family protein [Adhaeribacter soli]KAA9333625.1 TolC family protein [Adhaeribacter soli]